MVKKGLVACLDILGYQQIISNNQIEYVAERVTAIIAAKDNVVRGDLAVMVGE